MVFPLWLPLFGDDDETRHRKPTSVPVCRPASDAVLDAAVRRAVAADQASRPPLPGLGHCDVPSGGRGAGAPDSFRPRPQALSAGTPLADGGTGLFRLHCLSSAGARHSTVFPRFRPFFHRCFSGIESGRGRSPAWQRRFWASRFCTISPSPEALRGRQWPWDPLFLPD